MAVDLICPNCEDNLGKDVENPIIAYCGNCGEDDIYNERGYDVDEDQNQLLIIKIISYGKVKNRR